MRKFVTRIKAVLRQRFFIPESTRLVWANVTILSMISIDINWAPCAQIACTAPYIGQHLRDFVGIRTQSFATSTRNRSRITNGSELLRGVDGRSAEGRRYRDLTEAFRVEFGLGANEREMAAIRLAAALTVQSETLQAASGQAQRIAWKQLVRRK
jgi:hypothetical protein